MYGLEEMYKEKLLKEKLLKEKLIEGTKHDSGKSRIGLIPPEFVIELGDLYTVGAAKYEADNWRKGIAYTRVYDALQRHLNAWWAGEDKDPEDNISHLTHAAWNCITLWWYQLHRKDYDDRWKQEEPGPIIRGAHIYDNSGPRR